MCDEEANGIGEIVPNDRIIYRACTRKSFLSGPNRDTVDAIAFQKDGQNHKDGLSLALSVAECARKFPKNHGIIRISVGAIHGLNHGLEVHYDTNVPNHVIVRNVPCMDREPPEREEALAVSAELAIEAEVESSARVQAPPEPPPEPPAQGL